MKKVNKELLSFVKEGFFKAGEAYATIRLFEESLHAIWRELLHEFKDWGDFKPDLKNIRFNHSNRPYLGDWMVVFVNGIKISDGKQREFQLEYGTHPQLRAAWRNDPKFFDYDAKNKEIEYESSWSGVLYHTPESAENLDIKKMYKTLLKEILRFV
ncbi:hypothetical protein ACFL20_12950 [Spirochaetota bacterium]